MEEDEIANQCPVCRNNCNCKACLRLNFAKNVRFSSYHIVPLFFLNVLLVLIYVGNMSNGS